ncbi:wax ester/triacylglycerol synthase family O-acyltransferase [Pseudonocardia petroleophila]|uniref:Diacylglycerol O-acyltransferase n=1 Tax=Pseudonocardia petroleophila TaxID=37331 RepID=A0A7G7MFX3_9PSEU|nr:wax ester/triacylglycerol synthase family O-acyltransferase [Pseudonocardia petroleophila]QNG51684.1 wax ester/triacylglycerol synthase family O-acyltransferase [Pseudonocardia petroleophila]
MPDRLSPLDASFLYAEHDTAAMHVGGVMTFEPREGFDVDALVALIGQRLGLVPRYRQKVREVPGRLGLPVWVDDPEFDLAYHVRRSALAAPGTEEVLHELVGRLLSRQLDRSRPLWEIYLVEGLADGRLAVVTKTHHAMVDGLASVDIGAVLLDLTPEPRATPDDDWRPAREPWGLELAASAVIDTLRRPQLALDVTGRILGDVRYAATAIGRTVEAALDTGRTAARTRPVHPLNAVTGSQRRYGTARTPLADHRAVRRAHGGTVNDVVLAVVAGALRSWMISRGEPLTHGTTVRALVPVSVRARSGTAGTGSAGNSISAYFVDLPVAEEDPVARLSAVRGAMEAHKRGGRAVGAARLIGLVGLAPPVVHSLAARLTSQYSSQLYNVLITNVPGPPRPLYALGARMIDMFPVVPLAGGQAVAIGVTSYDGAMHYGLTADRDAMPDVAVLAGALRDALAELVATVP